jgi:hypothetical protein
MGTKTYNASCHCDAVRFRFTCEEITSGRRCNCSICIRKGVVMSSNYFRPSDVEVEGSEHLARYQFGDNDVNHFFCRTCGIAPFKSGLLSRDAQIATINVTPRLLERSKSKLTAIETISSA